MRRLLIITDHNAKTLTTLGTLLRHTLRGLPRDVFDDITYFGAPLGDEPDIKEVQDFNYADYTHVLCINDLMAGGSIGPFIGKAEVALYVCEPSPYLNIDVFPGLEHINKIVVPSVAIKEALQESSTTGLDVIEDASVVSPSIDYREYRNRYISSGDMLREDVLGAITPFKPENFVIFCDAKHAAETCHMYKHLLGYMPQSRLLIRANREQLVEVESVINGNDIDSSKVIIKTPKTAQQNAAMYLVSNLIYRPSSFGFWSFTMQEAMCLNIPVAAADDYVVGEMVRGSGISLPTSEFVPYGRSYINRVNSYDAAKVVAEACSNRHTLEAGTVAALAKYATADYRVSARSLIKEAFGL